MPVYVLIAGETEMAKIGWADHDVEARVRCLQSGHYEHLRLLRTIDTHRGAEGWLHQRFQPLRVRGEWFRFHPDMLTIEVETIALPAPDKLDTEWQLLETIDEFCVTHRVTPTAFGHRALNDPTLVHELRKGRECKRATRARIMEFIDAEGAKLAQARAAA